MVVPFGFSVGDFVGGVNLIRDIIKALESSGGASAGYQELITELYILEHAFILVKKLKLDGVPSANAALSHALECCRSSISKFLSRNKKFAPYLPQYGSRSGWKAVFKKIQWSFKEDDVRDFRSELNAHIGSINTLLSVYQIEALSGYGKRLQEQQEAILSQRSRLDSIAVEVGRSTARDQDIRGLRSDVRCVSRSLRWRKCTLGAQRVLAVPQALCIDDDETLEMNQESTLIPADRIVDDEATDDASGPSGHNASEFMDDTHDLPLDLSVSRTRETEQTLALQPTPTLNEYLVRKRWTFLGAWLRLTAYNQTRYEKDSHVLPSSRVQNATIMEIDVHTRFLAGEFQIMWGFLNGRASLVASLALPNIISNKPDPMISAISVGDLFTVRNLISEDRYQPVDESEVGSSLLPATEPFSFLQTACLSSQPDIISFLLEKGAKPNAGILPDFAVCFIVGIICCKKDEWQTSLPSIIDSMSIIPLETPPFEGLNSPSAEQLVARELAETSYLLNREDSKQIVSEFWKRTFTDTLSLKNTFCILVTGFHVSGMAERDPDSCLTAIQWFLKNGLDLTGMGCIGDDGKGYSTAYTMFICLSMHNLLSGLLKLCCECDIDPQWVARQTVVGALLLLEYWKRGLREKDFSELWFIVQDLKKAGFITNTLETIWEAAQADRRRPEPMVKLSSAHDFKRPITAHYLDPNCPSVLQRRQPRSYQDE